MIAISPARRPASDEDARRPPGVVSAVFGARAESGRGYLPGNWCDERTGPPSDKKRCPTARGRPAFFRTPAIEKPPGSTSNTTWMTGWITRRVFAHPLHAHCGIDPACPCIGGFCEFDAQLVPNRLYPGLVPKRPPARGLSPHRNRIYAWGQLSGENQVSISV